MSDRPPKRDFLGSFTSRGDQPPHLDLSRLRLPGRTLSDDAIQAIDPRKHPAFAKLGDDIDLDSARRAIRTGMLTREEHLVQKAFDKALGQPEPYPQESRDSLVELLADDYFLVGLSRGEHHTEQLISAFEHAAVMQAREQTGAKPPGSRGSGKRRR